MQRPNIIGARITEAMKLRNIKQSDLSVKTGVPKSSLSSYISGKYKPKQENTYKLAEVLNVNPLWLEGKQVPMELSDFCKYIDFETKYDTEKFKYIVNQIVNNNKFGKFLAEHNFNIENVPEKELENIINEIIDDLNLLDKIKEFGKSNDKK